MNFLFDLKYAARQMMQKPAFAATTILIMTIGLGLCMYNYSFIHGFMLKDLPFKGGDRMYVINIIKNGLAYNGGTVSAPDYLLMRDSLSGVEKIGAYSNETVTLSGNDSAIQELATRADGGMFDFTGVQPLMGRTITEQDAQPGANNVAVIGYDLWQSYFGGRQDVIDSTVYIDSNPYQVVGVMPPNYTFPNSVNLWLPLQQDLPALTRKSPVSLEVYVLLKPGHSVDTLNAELQALMARIAKEYPETNSDTTADAKTYRMSLVGQGGTAIMTVMLAAVGFVMLMACTNVGNLLLARANERSKETAIRVALGAPRGRLISQMMAESLIICAISGLLSILLAGWGLELTRNFLPSMLNMSVPFFWSLELDGHILGMAAAVVVATAFITGFLPALKISSGNFNDILRDGTRGALSKRAGMASKALVIFEITLSCCLLTVACALAIGTNIAGQADYGIDTADRAVVQVELTSSSYPELEQRSAYYKALEAELLAQPEIAEVAMVSAAPGIYTWFSSVKPEGYEESENTRYPGANLARAMPGALETLGVTPLAGRLMDDNDTLDTPFVAVVTEGFAVEHWGSVDNAIGKRFLKAEVEDSPWYTVIGVIPHQIFGQPFADMKHRHSVYTSTLQDIRLSARVILKGNPGVDPESLRAPLNRAMQSIDPQVPSFNFRTYEQILSRNTAGMGFISTVFNLFAIAAVLLAASGIYGVMANSISQRTHELGVRRALGSPDSKVMNMLLKQGGLQLIIGAALGVPLAILMGGQIVGMIGVNSLLVDATYVVMPLMIGAIVMLATYLPARKAILLEPSVALRYE